ncbi:putative membrane protein [Bordetella avium 197N]|uniref:Membrane protein n=2 Tax=Bordetella avium TaxID=521 RepID=Q2L1G5_BORA1|nr:putative membrane protein [Bordetella avium 197N]
MTGGAHGYDALQHPLQRSKRMSIIIMIIVGFIVGLIARALMPGDQSMGIVMTAVLGIVGSVVAGYLGQSLGWYAPGEPAGWIGSVVGAILLLAIVGLIARKRA